MSDSIPIVVVVVIIEIITSSVSRGPKPLHQHIVFPGSKFPAGIDFPSPYLPKSVGEQLSQFQLSRCFTTHEGEGDGVRRIMLALSMQTTQICIPIGYAEKYLHKDG